MPLGNLNASKWNNQNIHKNKSIYSTGDWSCILCRTSNYYWRDECTKCNHKNNILHTTRRISLASTSGHRQSSRLKEQQSIPSKDLKFKSSPSLDATRSKSRDFQHEKNLKADLKFPIPDQSKSKSEGPGLPYQVQHCILTLMERILEEACYEFAMKWVPELLSEKGWDCAEAVELSQWRSFLPAELPKDAIRHLSNYSLSNGLANAVKIRNAAVHRHICSNYLIRDMALQAKDLMLMFSDTIRQEKFYLLWVEIGEWENNQKDLFIARAQLEQALQITSERPVDKMDWTPNANLTEEHSLENTIAAEKEYYPDEMDLDM
ncbi:hypothetical protein K3495_g10013 [Podosphaera aphanis]|nr:hypothetical protein K3495_g10013 [Podosphaera aphanis]